MMLVGNYKTPEKSPSVWKGAFFFSLLCSLICLLKDKIESEKKTESVSVDLIFHSGKKEQWEETGCFPSGLHYWSLILLQVCCSKPNFKDSKIIITEIPFFTCRSFFHSFPWQSVGAAECHGSWQFRRQRWLERT